MLKSTTVAFAAFLFATSASAASQFIEQSRVIYPRQVGDLKLADTRFDERKPGAGVSLSYELASAPGLTIDVGIYPAGRMAEAEAMASGVADLRAANEAALRSRYADAFRSTGEKKLDLQLSYLETLHGRLLAYEFTHEAVRFEFRSLLFYRFDYFIEVRAGGDAFQGAELDQAIVQVAADLVPELRVANRGNCQLARPSIEEQIAELEANDPSARKRRGNSAVVASRLSAEQILKVVTLNRIEDQAVGCVPNFQYDAAKPRKGEEYTTIRFPEGFWTSRAP